MLEEGSFRGRTADFVFMFLFGGFLMTLFGLFASLFFLGQAFTIMLVYVWSRRNPYIRMNFFGLLNFQAPFLPWVLMGFSLLLGNSIIIDLLGIAVGHIYYFLEDVFPNQPGGKKLLLTPGFLWYLTHLKRIPTITLSLRIIQKTNLETETRTSSNIHSNFSMWPDSSFPSGLMLWPRSSWNNTSCHSDVCVSISAGGRGSISPVSSGLCSKLPGCLLERLCFGGQSTARANWKMSFPSSAGLQSTRRGGGGGSSWRKGCLGKDRGQSWTLDPGSDWK
ncbi:uncharacterized protein LOC104064482 isoform X3 [Cuculus canorus]|nr:uncharacterized protein LOC104064482 isoform X3 [Cuculus canorus]XP_053938799.1 uncharacterized protein LOC104064482 isoform X3 [Cuculus canorus]XP_053938800.1 uncharacterized protein LOC104064482 isoform X3 [Cuculus canorus]